MDSFTDVRQAITEVVPELPEESKHFEIPNAQVLAVFGHGDPALVLARGSDGLVLAEPRLEWHGQIPGWSGEPRFSIPNDWLDALTPERRQALQGQARTIVKRRMSRYRRCTHCGDKCMPEHLITREGRRVCHGCFGPHYGAVF